MIKAIAFDFVGVIGREKRFDPSPLQARIVAQFGRINDDAAFIQHFVEETGLPAQRIADETRAIIENLYTLREPELFEHLPPLRYCLASNHLSFLLDWFRTLPFSSHFELLLNPSEAGADKPHPAFYEALIRRMDLPARQILFVDDTLRNIEGAQAAGLQTLTYHGEKLLSESVNAWLAEHNEF